MASLVKKQQSHYDIEAAGLTADGRTVRRVEARADNLADVAEAFKLAAAEARKAHLPVARVKLSAMRAGQTEIAVVLEEDDPLAQSALLDGTTKVDAPMPPPAQAAPPPAAAHCVYCGPLPRPGEHLSACPIGEPPIRTAPAPRWTLSEILAEFHRQAPHLAPFTFDCQRGSIYDNVGRVTYLEAVRGQDCTAWLQYYGLTLAKVVAVRISTFHS